MKSRKNQAQASKKCFPVELHRMFLIPPTRSCDNIHEIMSAGESHYRLSAQGFYWGLVR